MKVKVQTQREDKQRCFMGRRSGAGAQFKEMYYSPLSLRYNLLFGYYKIFYNALEPS